MSAAKLTVGTDCSGMETPVMALQNLGVEIDHAFSCDVNAHAKRTIMANFPPKIFYDDLTTRDNTKTPKADLYVAGFPCQPFSTAGLQQGFEDARGRGEIFWHVRDYLVKRSPKVFVLENVSGLVRINGGDYYRAILQALEALGSYNLYSELINTKDYGVPQNRPRVYIIGIRRSCDDGSFEFPKRLPLPNIERFLDRRHGLPTRKALPPPTAGTARINVMRAVREIYEKGYDPLKVPFIVDCDSSPSRMKYIKGVAPCMTCSRAGGHWVTNRMRRMNKGEMMRLQGMDPASFTVAVTEAQLGKQIGNAMSCNVLERLFVRVLPAAGLIPHGVLRDRWEEAAALGATAAIPGATAAKQPLSAAKKALASRRASAKRPLATKRAPLAAKKALPAAAGNCRTKRPRL